MLMKVVQSTIPGPLLFLFRTLFPLKNFIFYNNLFRICLAYKTFSLDKKEQIMPWEKIKPQINTVKLYFSLMSLINADWGAFFH
jgi:hypothetical protein